MTLRKYQQDAIASWEASSYCSILEMATGTGKTLTAVTATLELARLLQSQKKSVLLLVVCPYLTLVDQWSRYFEIQGINVTKAAFGTNTWAADADRVSQKLAQFPGSRSILVASQATFNGAHFQKFLMGITSEVIFVADEVHNFGTRSLLKLLPKDAKFRLGLSATPNRDGDIEGTDGLISYFGEVSYRLTIGDAIALGCLSEYNYYPRTARLDSEEMALYGDLSIKIASILAGRSFYELNDRESKKAGSLMRVRGALLGGASAKWLPFWQDMENNHVMSGQLVYCAEGATPQNPSLRQVDQVTSGIHSRRLGLASTYEATTPRQERARSLKAFSEGSLKYLVSMRCLDEGVDIPTANVAYFLASSSNTRQFIQRRGRVLRLHERKAKATLYDYFVAPSSARGIADSEFERSLVKRELSRTMEFISAASNKSEALQLIEPLRSHFGN